MIRKNIFKLLLVTALLTTMFVTKAPADIIIVESDDWFASESNYTAIIDSGTLVLVQNCPGILGSC